MLTQAKAVRTVRMQERGWVTIQVVPSSLTSFKELRLFCYFDRFVNFCAACVHYLQNTCTSISDDAFYDPVRHVLRATEHKKCKISFLEALLCWRLWSLCTLMRDMRARIQAVCAFLIADSSCTSVWHVRTACSPQNVFQDSTSRCFATTVTF